MTADDINDMITLTHFRPVARGGGSGGSYDPPPQLPIPKILFHPLAILFHPLAILFHLSAILFHPLAILFHPSAILFHPLAILFHPWNMWMTSHGQCPRGGGVLVNPPPGWLATGLHLILNCERLKNGWTVINCH